MKTEEEKLAAIADVARYLGDYFCGPRSSWHNLDEGEREDVMDCAEEIAKLLGVKTETSPWRTDIENAPFGREFLAGWWTGAIQPCWRHRGDGGRFSINGITPDVPPELWMPIPEIPTENAPTVENQAAEFLRQFPWRKRGEDIEPTELSIPTDLSGLSQYDWALISCYPEKHGMTDKQALPLLRKQAERDPENRTYKAWVMRAATGILGKEIVNMVEVKEGAK